MVATLEMTRPARPIAKEVIRGRSDVRAFAHRVGVEAVARALDVFEVIDE